MSTQFRNSKYKFTYGTPVFDRIFMTVVVALLWAGSVFEAEEFGFQGTGFGKAISSAALLYVIWHSVASRTPREMRFTAAGVDIPSTWFPGVKENHVAWSEIVDVDVSSKKNLPTICLCLGGRRNRHIYVKGLSAYRRSRLVGNPGEKLFAYFCDVLGIAK